MKQRYFCFIFLVEETIEGTENPGRRRKQLCITKTTRKETGMREQALIARGTGLTLERLQSRRKARYKMKECKCYRNTLFFQYSDFPVSIIPTILNKEFFSLSSAGEEWMKNSRMAERLICSLLWVIDRNVVRLLIRSVSIPGKTTIFLQLK
jgi:hypothetical protein